MIQTKVLTEKYKRIITDVVHERHQATQVTSNNDAEVTTVQNVKVNLMKEKASDIRNVTTVKSWTGAKFTTIPKESITRYGFICDTISFQSLLTYQYIDNYVIDAFNLFLKSKYEDISLLNFPTDYVKIITNQPTNDATVIKWCQKMRAHRYDAWLLPLHNNEHWTLLLVVLSQKTIIYFDSLHGQPAEFWIMRVASLIERLSANRNNFRIQWSEWTLFSPNDVPLQGGIPGISNNCGGHMSAWTYIIYSGENIPFDEADMPGIRPWIMQTLLNPKLPKGKNNFSYEMSEKTIILQRAEISKLCRKEGPANYFSSTLEYAASLKMMLNAMKS